jgi:hypothetical protein
VGIRDLHPTIHTILAASVPASSPVEAMLAFDLQHHFLKR